MHQIDIGGGDLAIQNLRHDNGGAERRGHFSSTSLGTWWTDRQIDGASIAVRGTTLQSSPSCCRNGAGRNGEVKRVTVIHQTDIGGGDLAIQNLRHDNGGAERRGHFSSTS